MSNPAVLDLTRLVSRLGNGPLTGIDRVELAYLKHLPRRFERVYGLVRTPAGVLLFGAPGLDLVRSWAERSDLPQRRDLISRLFRTNPQIAALETALRAVAEERLTLSRVPTALRKKLGPFDYFNVGHSNLSRRTLQALHASGATILIMIHDTIPLDHPEYTRSGQSTIFEGKLQNVSRFSDWVIHLTKASQARTDHWFRASGRVPRGIVSPLGVDVPRVDASSVPASIQMDRPYFVMLGTVEPRKNHQLIIDVWETLPDPAPQLLIVGGKGWADKALLQKLDRGLPNVQFLQKLPDGAVAALLKDAAALLFPSFAEGFGLPPYEAAALGTPVIASDISVTREGLCDYPVYLNPTDSYSWRETILAHCAELPRNGKQKKPRQSSSWEDHFNVVLSALWNGR